MGINVTDPAIKKISELISEEGNNNINLRVYVMGGGCSGFQYGFAFDERVDEEEDGLHTVSLSNNNEVSVGVVIDYLSFQYLDGATIDYVSNLQGSHFVVINPNAKTTCGCGNSFSV